MDERKKKAIQSFFEEGQSQRSIARELGLDRTVICGWIEVYRYHGLEGLMAPACLTYDKTFKLRVIQHMIETVEPFSVVAGRFRIPSRATIWKWMHQYMSTEDWALYQLKRERRDMKKKQPNRVITDLEKLQEENELLRAENAYLKKLQALVQEKQQIKPKKK
ncbi:hypothetical protein MKY37_08040 [Psychrobacillus sp. FSL K6-2836]|uniref:hypothetical protein n=1 Tax=Psychrobacillus sp. FSL K6-2836 TaxID=2921548 RepID=UPI0030F5DC66